MRIQSATRLCGAAVLCLAALAASTGYGQQCRCGKCQGRHVKNTGPAPSLGTISDRIWRLQEHNGEASDFVIHQHEFKLDGVRLNLAGEDHVKEIAQRACASSFPIVIERSMTTARMDTEHQYPIHENPELDLRRREVVVRALSAMGVADAEQRVVVAPAFAEEFRGSESLRACQRFLWSGGGGSGGGGGAGGFGFGGIF